MNAARRGTAVCRFFPLVCALVCSFPLAAQESILSSYERNFIRAGLPAKPGILRDAATDERAGEFIGNLCARAIRFALENGEYFENDPDMIVLVGTAARVAGSAGDTASANSLWELFMVYRDSWSRVEILSALGFLGKGNSKLIENMNIFLDEQNDSFRRGTPSAGDPAAVNDFPVVSACVTALGRLGDSSSFPALFSAMTGGYSQAITQETLKALESLEGKYKEYLIEVIRNNPFPEKAAAFRIGAYNEKLSPAERGELAQTALEAALDHTGSVETSLRYDAVTVLTRLKWNPAAAPAIRNFYRVQTDYSGGGAPGERFVEAIACLGAMASPEAAQALALQLGYFNSQTERSGEYDEAVILALVNALGELGDKAAFDNLLYISYLNYPDKIQASAREALNRLKW